MCFENGMQFFESLQGICQQAIELKLMIERNSILRPLSDANRKVNCVLETLSTYNHGKGHCKLTS